MSKARQLADFISDSTVETAELADNAVTSAKLDETDSYTVAGLTATTADINGGTIDGVTIGGASAGAGTFTTFTSTGIDDNATSNAITIDSSERVLIGPTSTRATFGGNIFAPLQIERAEEGYRTGISLTHNQGTGSNISLRAPIVALARTRGSSLGDNDLVSENDYLGYLSWEGGDGTNTERASQIDCQVDGTPGNNDMPGRLMFKTTADGATAPTERMRITNDGKVGIGISPDVPFHVFKDAGGDQTVANISADNYGDGGITYLQIGTEFGDGSSRIGSSNSSGNKSDLIFETHTNSSGVWDEAMRIDWDQRVIVGHTSPITLGGTTPSFQIVGTTFNNSSHAATIFTNDANGPLFMFGKSRSTTKGTAGTIVQDGDVLGNINWAADDGTDLNSNPARISGQIDGTPGLNDTPGRILFYTASDGAAAVTERMRITNDGEVSIGAGSDIQDSSGSSTRLQIQDENGGGDVALRIRNKTTVDNSTSSLRFTNTAGAYDHGSIIAGRTPEVYMAFETVNGTEAMRIDQSQRVLIGHTSSPTDIWGGQQNRLQVIGNSWDNSGLGLHNYANDSTSPNISFSKSRSGTVGTSGTVLQDGDRFGFINFSGDDGTDINSRGAGIDIRVDGTPGSNDMPGRIVFETTADGASSPTERMRITNAGYVGIARTNPEATLHVGTVSGTGMSEPLVIFQYGDTSAAGADQVFDIDIPDSDPSAASYIRFTKAERSSVIGSITAASSTSVSFNTTSDYRLKNNVQPLTGALDRLNQLNPVTFNWRDCGRASEGFIAHEAQDVVPIAVMGDKDAVDENGNPDYQQFDYSKVVPLLTGALQEAVAKIEALEARVAQLEAN